MISAIIALPLAPGILHYCHVARTVGDHEGETRSKKTKVWRDRGLTRRDLLRLLLDAKRSCYHPLLVLACPKMFDAYVRGSVLATQMLEYGHILDAVQANVDRTRVHANVRFRVESLIIANVSELLLRNRQKRRGVETADFAIDCFAKDAVAEDTAKHVL